MYADDLKVEAGFWWDEDLSPDARAKALWQHVRSLEENQAQVHTQNLINARLYSNRELAAFDWGHGEINTGTLEPVSRNTENLNLAIVDTMVASLAKQKVKANFSPKNADYSTTRKVKGLDAAVYQEFKDNRVYSKQVAIARDMFLFGFYVWSVEVDGGKLCINRIFPDEFVVDHTEMISDDKPMTVYRRRCLPVEAVIAAYAPDDKELANRLRDQASKRSYLSYRWPGEGHVIVTYGWRRAVGDQPGKHVVSVRDVSLVDETWEHEWFPFVWGHYQTPITGFYAPSAVEQILPYQLRLNEINQVIRDAQDLMARPRLLVPTGSQVNLANLDNRIARVIHYTGAKPEVVNWQAVSAELYNERDRIVRNAFEFFGLSQLQGLQRLPAGARLDSSLALREATAKNDDRMAAVSELWEAGFLELAERVVQVASSSRTGLSTKSRGSLSMRNFSWDALDLDRSAYAIELGASSLLNQTPAARQDILGTWLSLGIISTDQYIEMYAHPDLEHVVNIKTAPARDIEHTIERLYEGKRVTPTPIQDLTNGIMLVTASYLDTKWQLELDDSVSQERKTKILNGYVSWINAARSILDKAKPKQPQAPTPALPPDVQPQVPQG